MKQRQPYKKREYKEKKSVPSNKQLAKEIKMLKHMPEIKHIDIHNNTALPQFFAPVNVGQGDDYNQRIGEEVIAKSLELTCAMVLGAGTNAAYFRVMVYWDKQFNGTGGQIATGAHSADLDALIDDNAGGPIAFSPLNHRCKERYTILYDKLVTLVHSDTAGTETAVLKKKIPLSNAVIKYSNSGATIASVISRGLSVLVYCSNSGTSAETNVRFNYIDT